MLDFVKNYPLKYYARTFLKRPKPQPAALFLQPDRVSAVVRSDGKLSHKDRLEKVAGAPSLTSVAKNPAGFSGAAFTSQERTAEARWFAVVDTPNFAAEVVDTAAKPHLQTLSQLKRISDPRALIEYLDPQSAKRFVFESVGLNLAQLTEERLPQKFMHVGLDRDIQARLEQWFTTTGQHLSAIVPIQVAALLACKSLYPREGIHVVASANSTTLGLFGKSGLMDCAFTMALADSVPYADFAGGVQEMMQQVQSTPELAAMFSDPENLGVYFFGIGFSQTQIAVHVEGLVAEGLAIQAIAAPELSAVREIRSEKGKATSFEAQMLGCLAGQNGETKK